MYKEATPIEKFLIVTMSFSILGFAIFKAGTVSDILNYSLWTTIFLLVSSRTIRTWKSTGSTIRVIFSLSILIVLAGAFFFALSDRMTGIVMFLIGTLVHSFAFDVVLRKHKVDQKIGSM